jgi:hypothetical protein
LNYVLRLSAFPQKEAKERKKSEERKPKPWNSRLELKAREKRKRNQFLDEAILKSTSIGQTRN